MLEKKVCCPFDHRHIMLESALQRHVIRCMAKYPDWLACPYNALHRHPNADALADHMMNCPERRNAASMFYDCNNTCVEMADKGYHNEKTRNLARSFNLKEENWDED